MPNNLSLKSSLSLFRLISAHFGVNSDKSCGPYAQKGMSR